MPRLPESHELPCDPRSEALHEVRKLLRVILGQHCFVLDQNVNEVDRPRKGVLKALCEGVCLDYDLVLNFAASQVNH